MLERSNPPPMARKFSYPKGNPKAFQIISHPKNLKLGEILFLGFFEGVNLIGGLKLPWPVMGLAIPPSIPKIWASKSNPPVVGEE